MSELSEAISALVDIRPVVTDQAPGEAHEGGIHVESLPSLLDLLTNGTGRGNNTGSSEPGLPFDAQALQWMIDLGDDTRDRCRRAQSPFSRDNLAVSLNYWQSAFDALYGAHNVEPEVYFAEVDWVNAWAARIAAKFDHEPTKEFTRECPAPNCGQRWVISPEGDQIEAISMNWKTLTAECRACGKRWEGFIEMVTLANPENPWIVLPTGERVYIDVLREMVSK